MDTATTGAAGLDATQALPPGPLPDNVYELAQLMRDLPVERWDTVLELLTAQLRDERTAVKLWEGAQTQIHHENQVLDLRDNLRTALDAALTDLYAAQRHLADLGSNLVFDEEYMGETGGDLRHMLADAARAVRAAVALNPIKPEGK